MKANEFIKESNVEALKAKLASAEEVYKHRDRNQPGSAEERNLAALRAEVGKLDPNHNKPKLPPKQANTETSWTFGPYPAHKLEKAQAFVQQNPQFTLDKQSNGEYKLWAKNNPANKNMLNKLRKF